jgi:hypothetical protein
MKRIHKELALLAAALAVTAAGAMGQPGTVAQGDGAAKVAGKLWVEGGSTVRAWDCEALELQVDATLGSAELGLSTLADAVSGLVLRVPTGQLDCDDNTMNGHMRDALDVETHRRIEFRMDSYRVLNESEGPQVELVGTLEIKGATQPVTLRATVEATEGGLRVRGVHTLDMTEYGVRPPRLMFGALRVHADVDVHFDLLMTRGGSGSDR